MHTKRIIAVCVALVLVVGVVGGGYYYWWIGTPQYSLLQLKDAVSRGDSTTALSYFNTDAIFNNLWTQVEAQASVEEAQATQSGGELGTLGAMIGQGILESIKVRGGSGRRHYERHQLCCDLNEQRRIGTSKHTYDQYQRRHDDRVIRQRYFIRDDPRES